MLEDLKSVFFNLPGWHTQRKLIVFESDDWGSIRFSSKEAYDYFKMLGYPLQESAYSQDSLESNTDITSLLEVLSYSRTKAGNYPVFTINNIVANPDFREIEKNDFKDYTYEPFTKTYENYPNHDHAFAYLKQGIEANLLKPQLHGREHINVAKWLTLLRDGDDLLLKCFKYSMYGLPDALFPNDRRGLQRALVNNNMDSNYTCTILGEATDLFENIWEYRPNSFIAPNYFWDDMVEDCLSKNGLEYLQGQRAQILTNHAGTFYTKYHFTGQRNKFGQIYLIRNCYFEPSFNHKKDWVASCLSEISRSFRLFKPAIISTHRVNYSGEINPSNREHGLRELKSLIKAIIHNWPEVEFISSDQLGDIITAN